MEELLNIKNFDEYIEYIILNESLKDGSQSICNKIFAESGIITFDDGTSVDPHEIVNVVDEALNYLADQYVRTFSFASRINIIFLRKSKKIKTMAVDENMNMYINACYVFKTLKMNKYLISAVIMHEVFHVLFNHIERENNWLSANGKTLNDETEHETNLAADIEVNQTLVRLGIIDEDALVNEIHGLYLKNASGELGLNTNVVPLEVILNNEKYMNKLRSMAPEEINPEDDRKIKSSSEWDEGYKEGWNKLAKLIKKYGYEKVWEKLQEAGIINAMGEIDMEKSIDDVNILESFEFDFSKLIIESFGEILKDDKGKTYDDGYVTAIKKIIDRMKSAIDPSEGSKKSKSSKNSISSGINRDDLEKIDIPNNKGEKSDSDDNPLPDNFNNSKNGDDENGDDENGDEENNNNNSNKDYSKDGEGKSDDELTDDDYNKLSDDLKNKSEGRDPGAIGGTGSFKKSSDLKDVLEDSGYSQEDIDKINEIREKNKERNSSKGIEKAREEVRQKLRNSDYVKKYLDVIDIESSKYKNIWKDIMKEFLANKTRRAGTKINDTSIDWKRKSRIALGNVGPQYQKVDQDPQDVNVYVDVSGSVDMGLLEIISKSLVEFSREYKYSGINICPWASTSNGIHRVDDFSKRSEDSVTDEILKIISKGISQCGGGTDINAAISVMIDNITNTLNDSKKKKKDDVHVVITDGYFDYNNMEKRMRDSVEKYIERDDVVDKVAEHTFWMIYDAPEDLQKSWKNEIKEGTLIFINSETVKSNG